MRGSGDWGSDQCSNYIDDDFFKVPPVKLNTDGPYIPRNAAVDPLVDLGYDLLMFAKPPVTLFETPIQIQFSYIHSAMTWNCVCAFSSADSGCQAHWPGFRWIGPPADDNMMNIVDVPPTQTRQYLISNPNAQYHTSDARLLCSAYSFAVLGPALQVRERESFLDILSNSTSGNTIGLTADDSKLHPTLKSIYESAKERDLSGAKTSNLSNPILEDIQDALEDFARCKAYSPKALGQILAVQTLLLVRWDGWNTEGLLRDESGVRCTSDCMPYRDFSGYNKGILNNTDFPSKDTPPEHRWQPMEETDRRGLFSKTLFTVPHIGLHAVPATMKRSALESRKAPPPEYNYTHEVELLLDRMTKLSPDKLDEIDFMNEKSLLIVETMLHMRAHYGSSLTFEKVAWFYFGISSVVYDGVITVWKEKVRYDLIRPTTYIQNFMPDRDLQLWSSPDKVVKGRDFQATVRVMPHSEYPSGSACICQTIGDFTVNALGVLFGDKDDVQPIDHSLSLRLPDGLQLLPDLSYPNYASAVESCGLSRLNAGLHFTASVPAGWNLCEGIGDGAVTGMMRRVLGVERNSDETSSTTISKKIMKEDGALYSWLDQPGGMVSTPHACKATESDGTKSGGMVFGLSVEFLVFANSLCWLALHMML